LSQYMLSSAATFGFFLAIGSVSTPLGALGRLLISSRPGYPQRLRPTSSSLGSCPYPNDAVCFAYSFPG
jgi:hypothetical protein